MPKSRGGEEGLKGWGRGEVRAQGKAKYDVKIDQKHPLLW